MMFLVTGGVAFIGSNIVITPKICEAYGVKLPPKASFGSWFDTSRANFIALLLVLTLMVWRGLSLSSFSMW